MPKIIGMKNKIIRGAAKLYYKENVEGEPLDQDTPIECFEAGAEFVIRAQKNRNKCNPSKENSYNQQKNIMDMYKKIVENVEKIDKVTGFHVTAPGDDSVGIPSASWEIKNDFYFDTPEELEEFKKEIKALFEWYCGEVTSVVTFEEHRAMLNAEDKMMYQQYPVRYLIRDDDGGNMFMRPRPFTGMYSSDVAECIHLELEDWIVNSHKPENIIPSTTKEYWEIITKALADEQRSLEVNGQHYHSAKRSVRRLTEELEIGYPTQNEVLNNKSTD